MDSMDEEAPRRYASADEFFSAELPEEDVEIRPGKWVRVRALTRAEMIRAQKMEDRRLDQERYLVSLALVQPRMTEDEVGRWQRSSAFMELERIGRVINRLGGIGRDAAKSDLHADGDD